MLANAAKQAFTIQTVAPKAPHAGGTHNASVAGSVEIAAQQASGVNDDLRDDGCEDDDPRRCGSHQLELFRAVVRSPLSPFDLLSELFGRVSVSAPIVACVGPPPSALAILTERAKP